MQRHGRRSSVQFGRAEEQNFGRQLKSYLNSFEGFFKTGTGFAVQEILNKEQ